MILVKGMIDWLIYWFNDMFTDWFFDFLIDRLTDLFSDWFTDWLINFLIHGFLSDKLRNEKLRNTQEFLDLKTKSEWSTTIKSRGNSKFKDRLLYFWSSKNLQFKICSQIVINLSKIWQLVVFTRILVVPSYLVPANQNGSDKIDNWQS